MWVLLRPPRFGGAEHASGHDSLLLFGHSSTEILVRVSVGEKSQTELECSRSVVLISKFRAFVPLPARTDSSFMTRPSICASAVADTGAVGLALSRK